VLVIGLLTRSAAAADVALEIAVDQQPRRLTRAELLAHPALREIEVPSDASYHRPMHYRAVPLSALIPRIEQADTIQFTARDGFVANIPAALLAAGQPWLAIEPADAPWPELKPGAPSAGPFYLVWIAPEKQAISPEQWPYQVVRISAARPLEVRYPQLVPKASLPAGSAERRGLKVYVVHCAACHPLDGGGDSMVGPDLNRPFSPTEYFQEPYLRHLIRDPGSVRSWPQRVMPGFSVSVMSDAALDDLLAYLRQMARQRRGE
jgi:mono/diheme cytochrome c family protein